MNENKNPLTFDDFILFPMLCYAVPGRGDTVSQLN